MTELEQLRNRLHTQLDLVIDDALIALGGRMSTQASREERLLEWCERAADNDHGRVHELFHEFIRERKV